jgi:hypothetical protein
VADDIRDRLRAKEIADLACRLQVQDKEIERLRAALDGIDRLHDYFNSMDDSSQSICYECGRNWPCETHLLVEEARRG